MQRWQGRWLIVVVIVVLSSAARPVGADEIHVIAPGETVADIAAAHGSTADALITHNGISDVRNLRVGEQLVMPPGRSAIIAGVVPY
ncbi:MAG: LysM peptidoglycan-binding domain-containing protein [Thermomicrobiales bacterium]|jgi:LysM repeat protein